MRKAKCHIVILVERELIGDGSRDRVQNGSRQRYNGSISRAKTKVDLQAKHTSLELRTVAGESRGRSMVVVENGGRAADANDMGAFWLHRV